MGPYQILSLRDWVELEILAMKDAQYLLDF